MQRAAYHCRCLAQGPPRVTRAWFKTLIHTAASRPLLSQRVHRGKIAGPGHQHSATEGPGTAKPYFWHLCYPQHGHPRPDGRSAARTAHGLARWCVALALACTLQLSTAALPDELAALQKMCKKTVWMSGLQYRDYEGKGQRTCHTRRCQFLPRASLLCCT